MHQTSDSVIIILPSGNKKSVHKIGNMKLAVHAFSLFVSTVVPLFAQNASALNIAVNDLSGKGIEQSSASIISDRLRSEQWINIVRRTRVSVRSCAKSRKFLVGKYLSPIRSSPFIYLVASQMAFGIVGVPKWPRQCRNALKP
jgi:hypothetical protein